MRISPLRLLLPLLVAAAVGVQGQSGPADRTTMRLPAMDSRVLAPQAEMATFRLPPGYRVELVASEPMVEEPVLIDWDSSGRMWVVELLGYMPDLRATGERLPNGRVSVLEDTNRDGQMDKKTVFLDGLVLPRALKVLEGGVLIGEPPNLWFARDTTGDLRADSKELVCDCYGFQAGNVEHNANGLLWALDNRIYTSEGEYFFEFRDGRVEPRRTLIRGQWGVTQDDAGFIYRNISPEALHVDVVPTPYYFRNPNLLRTRGSDESLGGRDLNTTFPVRSNRGVNRGYTPGALRDDGTLASYTGACAPTVYRGDRLPPELNGSVFVTEPTGNLVSRIIVSDDGTALRGRKAYGSTEFLASSDERFRPVNLSVGPDGTLYIVDMYRGIIQHMAYMTEYLRDHIVEGHLEAPVRRGRIFRVVHESTVRAAAPALGAERPEQLVERLSHPNGWWRDTAQRILVERHDTSVVPLLTALASAAPSATVRLHALWTLEGLGRLEPAVVIAALEHPSRDVRVSALRLAERWLPDPVHPVSLAVRRRVDDSDWAVRAQLAATLGELPPGPREIALTALIDRHGDDPVVLDAAISGLRGREAAVIDSLLSNTAHSAARELAITMLSATVVRTTHEGAVQGVVDHIVNNGRPSWQRFALLRGFEVALLGVPAPETAAAITAAPNRMTTAGRGVVEPPVAGRVGQPAGRGAPVAGSSPAFPGTRPRDPNGRPLPTATVRLMSEPSLAVFASQNRDELAARSALVLERIEWPGKPGIASVPALSSEEYRRFEAGRQIYTNLCAACHQTDGRGQARVAPPLVGSELALAPAAVTARIVIGGKEGSIGLMPPLGSALGDEEVAAVLTYVRREWGQTGTPVDAMHARAAREASTDRRRPWTTNELTALMATRPPR